ncbi:unnamed protein product [Discula destructiva]
MSSPAPDLTPASTGQIPAQKEFDIDGNAVSFPLVLTSGTAKPSAQRTAFSSTDEVVAWITQKRAHLTQLAQTHGAILLRDFPVPDAGAFDAVCKAFGLTPFPYIGGAAPRTVITGSVFTANESPADQLIPFHHEMAQAATQPGVLFFYCQQAPTRGGQTPLALSHLVYERVRAEFPAFVAALEDKGVRYVRVLPREDDPSSAIGRGWKSTFAVARKEDAERVGREMGMELEWVDGDGGELLKTTTKVMPATRNDLRSGKTAWFNSIVAAFTGWKDTRNDPRKAVVFGDGGELDPDVLTRCQKIMDEVAVSFDWEKGDVLMVDNWVAMHSRNSFEGARVVYASLWK